MLHESQACTGVNDSCGMHHECEKYVRWIHSVWINGGENVFFSRAVLIDEENLSPYSSRVDTRAKSTAV